MTDAGTNDVEHIENIINYCESTGHHVDESLMHEEHVDWLLRQLPSTKEYKDCQSVTNNTNSTNNKASNEEHLGSLRWCHICNSRYISERTDICDGVYVVVLDMVGACCCTSWLNMILGLDNILLILNQPTFYF